MNKVLLVAAGVAVVAVAGCTGSSTSVRPAAATPTVSTTEAAPSTPTAVVVAYYQRLGRHDAAGADVLLSPSLRAELPSGGPRGQATNIKSLTNIRDVKAAIASFPPEVPAGYVDVTQVFVTFDAVYVHPDAAQNGPNSRFLYVARKGKGGPWQIVEIGTGP